MQASRQFLHALVDFRFQFAEGFKNPPRLAVSDLLVDEAGRTG